MKKILSILFAVLIALSVFSLPVAVSAAESTVSTAVDNDSADQDNAEVDSDKIPGIEESNESSVPEESSSATTEPEPSDPQDSTEPSEPTEPVITPPAAVQGFEVKGTTTKSVKLTWIASADADRYSLFRAAENPEAKKKFTYVLYKTFDDVNTTCFNDVQLNTGTVYKYKLFAEKVENDTVVASKAAKITAVTNLVIPKKLKATKPTASGVTISWKSVNNADGYHIYRKSENATNFTKVAGTKQPIFEDAGIKAGTFFEYKVVAVRTVDGVEYSGVEGTVSANTMLKAPKKIKVEKATTKKIVLSWKPINNAGKYEVYRKSENAEKFTKFANTKKLKFTDKKLVAGLDYTYKVRAKRTVNGKTIYSEFTYVTTPAGVVSVSDVKVKSHASRGVITWAAASGVNGYDIFIRKPNGKEVYEATTTIPAYLTDRHTPNKAYFYVIKSFRNVGNQKVYGSSKVAKVQIVATAYGRALGGNYLEVCTETQVVNMYMDGQLYATTPVVTGTYGAFDTTPGYHHILNKKTPARLKGAAGNDTWDVEVRYWLAFTYDGQGFHDSTWRTSGYGGNIYKYNGSHGCVNTPISVMGKIFAKAYVGMPVIVY